MPETPTTSGTAPVNDRRPVPRGVLPKGLQMWLMVGVAAGMILIIFVTGQPAPSSRPARAPEATVEPPNPDRLREYQDRLRIAETRAAQESQGVDTAPTHPSPDTQEPAVTSAPDPIVAERRRRAYDSLFASNVVLSRRLDSERPQANAHTGEGPNQMEAAGTAAAPSVDQIADAVVRATRRAGGNVIGPATSAQTAVMSASHPPAPPPAPDSPFERQRSPVQTERISPAGSLHRILEGTIFDTVLTNRLDGGSAAPVNCLLTNAVYSHSGHRVLIPAGARILGETKAVQTFGETRLAVAFHRLVLPDGSTFSLDRPPGLNQTGDAGVRDQVNQHYWSTFGAAAAVGLVSGLSQFLGAAGLGGGQGDRTVVIAGGSADAASQAGLQVMNRFLNRLPTITIREGHRIKVYLTSDLELPAYTQ